MDCGSVSTCEIALSMNYRAEATLEQDYMELKYGHGGGKKIGKGRLIHHLITNHLQHHSLGF